MPDPLPSHIWFVRAGRGAAGAACYPVRREGWMLLRRAAFGFIAIVLATLYLCGVAEDYVWLWLIAGALLFWRTLSMLRRFLATHSDLSLTVAEVKAIRARSR